MSTASVSEATVSTPEEKATASDAEFDAAMRAELERRITALAEAGDASFGVIARGEWIVTIVVTLAIPLFLVWVFR